MKVNLIKPMITRRQLLYGMGAALGTTVLSNVARAGELADALVSGNRRAVDNLLVPSSSTFVSQVTNDTRSICGNGLPSHFTGLLATPQYQSFKIPATPQVGSAPTPCGSTSFGVVVENAVLIDPTGPNLFQNGQTTKLGLDPTSALIASYFGLTTDNQGHLQPGGGYHFHYVPSNLIQRLVAEKKRRGESEGLIFLGFAADGFPIYYAGVYGGFAPQDPMDPNSTQVKMSSGYRLRAQPYAGRPLSYTYVNKAGKTLDTAGLLVKDYEFVGRGTLDECNGRYGYTREFGLTYYYFCTDQWPYFSRQWKGTPLASSGFERPDPDTAVGNSIPNAVATLYDMGIQGY